MVDFDPEQFAMPDGNAYFASKGCDLGMVAQAGRNR